METHKFENKKNSVYGKRSNFFPFWFKINHIKQSIKVEIIEFVKPIEGTLTEKRPIFIGFYNFARCVLKNGELS